jgi:predicted house-cleaning noncanonical NTP pyrophosphatase (MazG superfamily)
MSKLVRDNTIELKKAEGESPAFHIADDEEYWTKLKAKFAAEVGEFARDESIVELGDVLEIIDAIIAFKGFDRAKIDEVRRNKTELRGGFGKRIILD